MTMAKIAPIAMSGSMRGTADRPRAIAPQPVPPIWSPKRNGMPKVTVRIRISFSIESRSVFKEAS